MAVRPGDGASRGRRAHPVVRGRRGRSRKDHHRRPPRPDRGGPGRGVRLPRGQHPGVAAARLGLPARLPVLRLLHRPLHQDGPRQPGHPVLPLLPARRRRVRGHRPPRHDHRPELPGARRRLLPRRGAGQPDRVRRPGDRDRRRRDVRAAVRPRRSRGATTSRSARAPRCCSSARSTATGTPSGAAPSASAAPTAPGARRPCRTPRRWPSATGWPGRSCCPGCGRSSPSPSGST